MMFYINRVGTPGGYNGSKEGDKLSSFEDARNYFEAGGNSSTPEPARKLLKEVGDWSVLSDDYQRH